MESSTVKKCSEGSRRCLWRAWIAVSDNPKYWTRLGAQPQQEDFFHRNVYICIEWKSFDLQDGGGEGVEVNVHWSVSSQTMPAGLGLPLASVLTYNLHQARERSTVFSGQNYKHLAQHLNIWCTTLTIPCTNTGPIIYIHGIQRFRSWENNFQSG